MELRQITEADLPFVLRLRNLHREAFLNSAEITEEEQKHWFTTVHEKYINFFVIWQDTVPVGTVSTKAHGMDIEIGNTMLDPLCPRVLRHGVMFAAIQAILRADRSYIAFVREGNTASRALTTRLGFMLYSVDAGIAEYIKQDHYKVD